MKPVRDGLYLDEDTQVLYEKMLPVTHERAFYEGFKQEVTLLPKGYQYTEGAFPFQCDTIYERDVAVTLRDGTVIYADVYRPATEEKLPAIVSCCWAGKSARHDMWGAALYPGQNGPLHSILSGRQLWLGLDPAKWCAYGYVVVAVDSRGVYKSEGNVRFPSVQEGQDGYDVVEWASAQSWCNEKVAMAGQRWTGEMQWFTAAECPPHLVCFAPWDAHGNLYMDEFVRGGIQKARGTTIDRSFGDGYIEAIDDMTYQEPLYTEYWKQKTVNFENIKVPVFLLGNYNSKYHTRGNVDAFRRVSSTEKWFKLCDFDGYEDFYSDKHLCELKEFFDYFLKGMENGWDQMPRVRMQVMDFGGTDLYDRVEETFPLERQQPMVLYLNAETMTLQEKPDEKKNVTEYDSEDKTEKRIFTFTFSEDTEISGFSNLKLWLSTEVGNDMDVFVSMGKMDAEGNILDHDGYYGPTAKLRVSHREVDREKSNIFEPYLPHRQEMLLHPGEIVEAEFGIWPTSMLFHKGEKLYITISGYGDTGMPPVYEPGWKDVELRNHGKHRIYTGADYPSALIVPVVEKIKM